MKPVAYADHLLEACNFLRAEGRVSMEIDVPFYWDVVSDHRTKTREIAAIGNPMSKTARLQSTAVTVNIVNKEIVRNL